MSISANRPASSSISPMKTLYHTGGTEIFGDMALIEELHQPKIGIVPIGDRLYHGRRSGCTRLLPL
jgi:L-ascorbate metabolism protein UlaG (beta-lactamase superfamily)